VVGCIDNHIDVLFGDVALREGDLHSLNPNPATGLASICDDFDPCVESNHGEAMLGIAWTIK
jgi:hypothetical protein